MWTKALKFHRYLSVNYESSNFSISQCVFEDGVPANILPFLTADAKPESAARNQRAIIGGTVGAAAFLILSLIAFFVVKFKWHRPKTEGQVTPSTSSESLSPIFPPISSTPKEIGENSLAGFHNGYREMDGTSLARLVRQSRSIHSSQSGTRICAFPTLSSSPTSSRSKLLSPTISNLERDSRQNPRWNHRRATFEKTIPPGRTSYKSGTSILGRPLPPTPKEKDAASFQTYGRKEEQVRQTGRQTGRQTHHEKHQLIRSGTPF